MTDVIRALSGNLLLTGYRCCSVSQEAIQKNGQMMRSSQISSGKMTSDVI
jgi:hypothetical protein